MKLLNNYKYFISFIFANLLVLNYIWDPRVSLIDTTGDSYSIWQTISTFNTNNVIASYVLYKGVLSIYPYVWLYELSIYLKLDQFLFIKIYHSILFGLSAGIAIPFTISKLTNIKSNIFINLFCLTILFYLLRFTYIFNTLMIDLPSFTFFSLAVYFFLNINYNKFTFINTINIIFFAVFISFSFKGSGQYFLACAIIICIHFFNTFKSIKINKKFIKYIFMHVCIFTFIFSFIHIINKKFETSFVTPLRVSGSWIPTGSQWFIYGITSNLDNYKYDGNSYKSNRGIALMMDAKHENFNEMYDQVKKGGVGFSIKEYILIISKYPVDFFVMWGTKLFMAFSFDGGKAKITHLIFSYSIVYVCLRRIYNSLKSKNSINKQNTFIYLSVFCTVAAPVFFHIEMRYCITLFSFMLFFSIFSIYESVRKLSLFNKTYNGLFILVKSNLHLIVLYIAFIFYSFVMYGSFLEMYTGNLTKIIFIN